MKNACKEGRKRGGVRKGDSAGQGGRRTVGSLADDFVLELLVRCADLLPLGGAVRLVLVLRHDHPLHAVDLLLLSLRDEDL